jgi:hydrogenase small subunit
MKLEKASAVIGGGLPVVWINGQSCTGCTVSLANSVYYMTVQELLLTNAPADGIDLKYSETLSSQLGHLATDMSAITGSTYVLAIEGAIPTGPDVSGYTDGMYCQAGDFGATSEAFMDTVAFLADNTNCAAVLNMGTCSSYGGIPAASGNVTGSKGFLSFWAWKMNPTDPTAGARTTSYRTIRSKTVNIPGCPPNPNWMVGSIAYVLSRLTEGVKLPQLDALRRPRMYYGERICNYCDRFLTSTSDPVNGFVGVNPTLTYNRLSVNEPLQIGSPTQNVPSGRCLKLAGCKGSRTKSDCSWRKWHADGYLQPGQNWCVGAGAPCQGCTQNFFPDRMSPFHYIR